MSETERSAGPRSGTDSRPDQPRSTSSRAATAAMSRVAIEGRRSPGSTGVVISPRLAIPTTWRSRLSMNEGAARARRATPDSANTSSIASDPET